VGSWELLEYCVLEASATELEDLPASVEVSELEEIEMISELDESAS
jgi:hypothetical protein